MRLIFLLWSAISIIYLDLSGTFADKKCYDAKVCIHDGKEKCGRDQQGNVRRFLDSCDIQEYNCLQKVDYVKVDKKECNDLPKISDSDSKGNSKKTKPKKSDEVKQRGDDEKDGDSGDQNDRREKKLSEDDKKPKTTKANSKKPKQKSRNKKY